MASEMSTFIITVVSFLAGGLVSWLILRLRVGILVEKGNSGFESERIIMQEKLKEQEGALSQLEDNKNQLLGRISSLESNYNETEKQLAVTEQKLTRIKELEAELEKSKQKTEEVTRENTNYQKIISALKTRSEEERKKSDEKLSLLNEAKEELKNQFKALAGEIFDEKGKKLSDQNKEKLDTILTPFNDQLRDFKKKVDDVYVNEAKERASLKQELESLRDLNSKLNQEAVNLTRALKGDKKKQGDWGELILERVLEQSGLRKGYEYDTQDGYRDAENKLLKPDVIVHLPENKDIIIDSKVSLVAYEQYSSATNDDEQLTALNEHVKAIRTHIKLLSDKDYSNLTGVRSLDFVLMFIPIEPAYMVAFQHADDLFADAFKQKIVIVTPTTLLATLRTIENIWRYERQNQNTLAIAQRAGAIYDKLRGFVEELEKLGNQITTVHGTYDSAMNKLTRGKGNLVSQAQRFVDLGVKVKKEFSKSVLETSDLEPAEDIKVLENAESV